MDPHRILHYVYSVVGIRSEPAVLQNFWATAAANGLGFAKLQTDPTVEPIGIYADETKYGLHESQEKILGITLNLVLFRPRNIRLSRFLICCLRSKYILPGTATLYPILNHIVWSLGWASRGIFPNCDKFGGSLRPDQAARALQPLGARFCVTELRGDLGWHKQAWGFQYSGWQSKNACFFCKATSSGDWNLSYAKTGPSAPWRQTIFKDTLDWATEKLDLRRL